MTDKGWICLAVVMLFFVLALAMIALCNISGGLAKISKRLDETNNKLQDIYYAEKHTGSTISGDIKDASEAIYNVYESMFNNAEVTIRRNGIEEDDDDNS